MFYNFRNNNRVIENKNEDIGAGASILPVKANVDVREGDNQYGLMGYLNKQTEPKHTSFDPMSSTLTPPDAHNPIVKRYKKRMGMNRKSGQYKYHTHHGIRHFI